MATSSGPWLNSKSQIIAAIGVPAYLPMRASKILRQSCDLSKFIAFVRSSDSSLRVMFMTSKRIFGSSGASLIM